MRISGRSEAPITYISCPIRLSLNLSIPLYTAIDGNLTAGHFDAVSPCCIISIIANQNTGQSGFFIRPIRLQDHLAVLHRAFVCHKGTVILCKSMKQADLRVAPHSTAHNIDIIISQFTTVVGHDHSQNARSCGVCIDR